MKMKKLAVMTLATALSVGSVMTASAAWLQEGSNWKYQNVNGTFQTGSWFQDADGKWYHFDGNGIMQKGWFQDVDGKWYFMAYHGAMQTGLIRVDNAVYFMNPSGELFIGDKEINGVTYNFGLYGTTNGTPSVGQTATFGGNGNQTRPGGGSSSSKGSSDNSGSSKSQLKTASTVTALNDLAKEGYTNLKYSTTDGGEVTLTEANDVDYSKVSLSVYAPNQTITNEISFKSITIEAVKPNTWNEDAGNKITLKSDARIVSNGEGTVINVATSGIQVKLEGSARTGLNITASGATVVSDAPVVATVSKSTVLVINDTEGSAVEITEPVTVEVMSSNSDNSGNAPLKIKTTAKAEVRTAIPAAITSTKEITLVITHSSAAEGTTVKAADSNSDDAVAKTEIKNESTVPANVEVKKADDTVIPTEEVPAGTTTIKSVEAGIKAAVDSANKSSYISASINEEEHIVTVTFKKTGSALVDTLPTARTIFNIFKSVDGVKYISVGSYDIVDDSDMIEAARELGFNGATKLEDIKNEISSYDVTVFCSGDIEPIEYTVKVK